jgi:hypothetical protein
MLYYSTKETTLPAGNYPVCGPVFLEQRHTGGILHDLDTSISKDLATWGDD